MSDQDRREREREFIGLIKKLTEAEKGELLKIMQSIHRIGQAEYIRRGVFDRDGYNINLN